MYTLIIDKDLSKYQPQFNMSKVFDIESISLNKFEKVYLLIDDLNFFKQYFELCNENVIFIYNWNIKFQNNKLKIKIINNENQKPMVLNRLIKHQFIKTYLRIEK